LSDHIWAEVVTIGSELVLGQLVDTNAAYIAQRLSEIGVGLAFHSTVGDDRRRMVEALTTALNRCQIVITTGGIGPTEDDLTREVAAEIMGVELILRDDLLAYIQGLFARMGYQMTPNNRRQAYIPAGSTPIHNPMGTAPAFYCEKEDRVLICLPGVPRETEYLIPNTVIPYLKQKYSPSGRIWVNRVLKVCGVGESNVDSQIKDIIKASRNPFVGLQASPNEIKVRLTAMAATDQEAGILLDDGERKIRDVLGDLIFGVGDDTLAGNTAARLTELGLSAAVAEAATQGIVTAELGRRLNLGQLKGALILGSPTPAADLIERIRDDYDPDVALAVSASPGDDGRLEVDILIESSTGKSNRRSLSLGGPQRLIVERSATMTMFTLWKFLKDYEKQ
jgi:nicotinamide-nucleotide amidase